MHAGPQHRVFCRCRVILCLHTYSMSPPNSRHRIFCMADSECSPNGQCHTGGRRQRADVQGHPDLRYCTHIILPIYTSPAMAQCRSGLSHVAYCGTGTQCHGESTSTLMQQVPVPGQFECQALHIDLRCSSSPAHWLKGIACQVLGCSCPDTFCKM